MANTVREEGGGDLLILLRLPFLIMSFLGSMVLTVYNQGSGSKSDPSFQKLTDPDDFDFHFAQNLWNCEFS